MSYSVKQQQDGTWALLGPDGSIIEAGLTNAGAWRKAEIFGREALNRSEDTSAWVFKKEANRQTDR